MTDHGSLNPLVRAMDYREVAYVLRRSPDHIRRLVRVHRLPHVHDAMDKNRVLLPPATCHALARLLKKSFQIAQ